VVAGKNKNIRILPGLGLILEYKSGLMMLVAGCVSVFFLLLLLQSLESLFRTHFDLQTGFLPGAYVQFMPEADIGDSTTLRQTIKNKFPDLTVIDGYEAKVKNASFSNGVSETLDGDITLLGFNFTGDRLITLEQNSRKYDCTIESIEKFGSWVLRTSGCVDLEEGPASLLVGQDMVPVDIYGQMNSKEIYFSDIDSNEHDSRNFFSFLDALIGSYFDLNYSGLLFDRFISPEQNHGFQAFREKGVLAYSRIIFASDFDYEVPVLVSKNLMSDNSRYEIETQAQLQIDSQLHPLVLVDGFGFEAEKYFSNNVVLMNKNAFESDFSTLPHSVFVNIYGNDMQRLEEAIQLARQSGGVARVIRKGDAAPGLLTQMKVISSGKAGMVGTLYLVLFLMLFISLQKFYSIFDAQLYLLKLYGYNRPLFSISTVCVLLVAGVTSFALIKSFFFINNQVLKTYFYPELSLSFSVFIFYTVSAFLALIPIAFIEKFYNMNRVVQR